MISAGTQGVGVGESLIFLSVNRRSQPVPPKQVHAPGFPALTGLIDPFIESGGQLLLCSDKERKDVQEYCISEGWVKVPAGKTLDRSGGPLLIKLTGKVEAFYR